MIYILMGRYNPSYSAIKRHLGAYWTPGASLAVLGDGSYDLPQLCYDQGEITDITVIDADQALLDQLRGANILQRPHMKFVLRDLASRVFDASLLSFDMILDKVPSLNRVLNGIPVSGIVLQSGPVLAEMACGYSRHPGHEACRT